MFQDITAQIGFNSSFPYLATVLGVSGIAGTLGLQWWKQNKYKPLQALASPHKHWLLGNIPELSVAVKQRKFFQLLFDWSKQLGPMYVIWNGSRPIVILSKPKVIDDTIINGMRDGSLVRSKGLRKAWNDISSSPILLGETGTEWQWRRKVWNPEFSSSSLSKYFKIINQACEQVIETIRSTTPASDVKVDPLFVELTMRVICCLVFGIPVDKNSANFEGPPLEVSKVYEAMSIVSYRFLRQALGEKRWMKYLPTKNSRDYWAAKRYLEDFLVPRVDLALQMREQDQKELPQVSSLFRESMLVRIAVKEPKYNREALIAEAVELLIAGTDTTAHTLSFAVGELSLNPRVFLQARNIVDQVCLNQSSINIESLKELGYIRAIIKETLRLYSVASGSTSLETQRDTMIEGKLIPRGTGVSWSMLAAGRDPEVYANPEEFLPERWLENNKESNLLPMIDFGSGSHRCLGEHLSMLEATMMLALLILNFDWELVNGRSSLEQLQQNILIYPSDKMPVRFRLRNNEK